jgi:hypothetical protein
VGDPARVEGPVRQEQAQGILYSVRMLAAHIGYGEPKRALKDAGASLDDSFRIEEQKSAVVTATAARDPQGLP